MSYFQRSDTLSDNGFHLHKWLSALMVETLQKGKYCHTKKTCNKAILSRCRLASNSNTQYQSNERGETLSLSPSLRGILCAASRVIFLFPLRVKCTKAHRFFLLLSSHTHFTGRFIAAMLYGSHAPLCVCVCVWSKCTGMCPRACINVFQ